MSRILLISLLCATLVSFCAGFAAPTPKVSPAVSKLVAASSAAVLANLPLLVKAVEEADEYEYGSVNAPISIAVVGGILAVLTALLPLLLRGGEEAFEEMRDRDADTFGKKNKALDKKKK